MVRARSDKSKGKPSVGKEKARAGRSDEGEATNAESAGRGLSKNSAQRNSLPPVAANPQKRQEHQRMEEEPSADLQESEKFSEEALSIIASPDGHQDSEDHPATHRRIAEQAFTLFQESGCEHGNDWAHWFEAERQIKETQM
ncbi:MAG TPA: DUF2934 domain-containing protein [Nitrospira sp.]|nr:DUF2934 domain-containing protein [Nitrospira sp.]